MERKGKPGSFSAPPSQGATFTNQPRPQGRQDPTPKNPIPEELKVILTKAAQRPLLSELLQVAKFPSSELAEEKKRVGGLGKSVEHWLEGGQAMPLPVCFIEGGSTSLQDFLEEQGSREYVLLNSPTGQLLLTMAQLESGYLLDLWEHVGSPLLKDIESDLEAETQKERQEYVASALLALVQLSSRLMEEVKVKKGCDPDSNIDTHRAELFKRCVRLVRPSFLIVQTSNPADLAEELHKQFRFPMVEEDASKRFRDFAKKAEDIFFIHSHAPLWQFFTLLFEFVAESFKGGKREDRLVPYHTYLTKQLAQVEKEAQECKDEKLAQLAQKGIVALGQIYADLKGKSIGQAAIDHISPSQRRALRLLHGWGSLTTFCFSCLLSGIERGRDKTLQEETTLGMENMLFKHVLKADERITRLSRALAPKFREVEQRLVEAVVTVAKISKEKSVGAVRFSKAALHSRGVHGVMMLFSLQEQKQKQKQAQGREHHWRNPRWRQGR